MFFIIKKVRLRNAYLLHELRSFLIRLKRVLFKCCHLKRTLLYDRHKVPLYLSAIKLI